MWLIYDTCLILLRYGYGLGCWNLLNDLPNTMTDIDDVLGNLCDDVEFTYELSI